MNVCLARVDERLIHGQVMTAWVKKAWIKKIMLVDDEIVKDDFMKEVLSMSAPAGVKVEVCSAAGAAQELSADTSDENTMLLFKDLKNVESLTKAGFKLKELNIGNIGNAADRKPITKEIYVSDEEKKIMSSLIQEGVYVYIQKLPQNSQVDVSTKL